MRYLENIKRKLPQFGVILLIAVLILVRQHLAALEAKRQILQDREFSGPVLEAVREIFPAAHSIKRVSEPGLFSTVFDKNDTPVARFLLTSPLADDIRGYAGPVPFLIGIDQDNQVKGLRLLDHSETGNFIDYIEQQGFFNQWNGLSTGEAIKHKVDTITAATMTTSAVIRSLRKRLSLLPESFRAGHDIPADEDREAKPALTVNPGLLASSIVGMTALACFLLPSRTRTIRPVLLAVSVLVLGFWNGRFLSLTLINGWLRHGVSWTATPFLLVLGVLSLALPLFTNRNFYCAYICPYGAAQELAARFMKKKPALPPRMRLALSVLRRVLLVLAVAAMLFRPSFDLTMVEPFSAFLVRSAGVPMLFFGGVFLLVGIFIPRCWCRFFCPTGQLTELAAKTIKTHKPNNS